MTGNHAGWYSVNSVTEGGKKLCPSKCLVSLFAWDYNVGIYPDLWALINISADFTVHPDKISARDLSYAQLHEFEASVSPMEDTTSRPKPGIKWIWAYLPWWLQFFRKKFGKNVEGDTFLISLWVPLSRLLFHFLLGLFSEIAVVLTLIFVKPPICHTLEKS